MVSLAVASCFASSAAFANPTGPTVVHGTAAIHQAGNLLQITNSPSAIINWQSFSIGVNEITRFIQQSQASAVLNRVTGSAGAINPSVILGALQSNGRVFLINPSGVLFGAGAQIDVAGLVATSLNLSNADFLAGRMNFTAMPNAGSIVNEGNITTSSGGNVYLVGPAVTNSGIITSPQGEVVLAAGNSVELVNPGTPDLRVEVSAPDNEARNLGQVIADSGRIGIYAGLVNQSGTIRADSAVSEGGRILLKATKNATLDAGSTTTANGASGGSVAVQSGDTTLVSGAIDADGAAGKGGDVKVLGNLVGLTGSASINASGETGGGTVLVGGDFQGKNPDIKNAFRTYVGHSTNTAADAISSGDGGKVIVWSDDATRAYGTISARGGAQGGNGGLVEVSGKGWLDFNARVDTSAPLGVSGSLLLDPADVEIIAGEDNFHVAAPGFSGTNPMTFDGGEGLSRISWQTIKDNLTSGGGANVIITTSSICCSSELGNITVVDNSPDLATTNTLQLVAHRDIAVNGSITNTSSGAVKLYAGWDGTSPAATPTLNFSIGNIVLKAPVTTNQSTGQVILAAGGSITQDSLFSAPVTADKLLAKSSGGNVAMNDPANSVNVLAGTARQEFSFTNARPLTIGSVGGVNGILVSGSSSLALIEVLVTGAGNNLTVVNNVIANACDGDCSDPTTATVNLTAGTGGELKVEGASVIANAGNNYEAIINLTANGTGGKITIDNSTIRATDSFNEGDATVTLTAGSGGITVDGGEGISAHNTGGGGTAIRLSTTGGITLSATTISSTADEDGTSLLGLDAGQAILATDSTIESISNASSSAIIGMKAGTDIT
ncbi:MAG: hypothetical protein A3I02_17145, partial [Betaproteobacteria bacterium RIFCSPLOWO2_02_FULL_67_26]